MQNAELRNAIKEAVDVIHATAKGLDISLGALALALLRKEDIPVITKKAALRVRTEELVKQNPHPAP